MCKRYLCKSNFVQVLPVTLVDLGCGRLNADISVGIIMNARLYRKVQRKFIVANITVWGALALGRVVNVIA